MNAENGSERCQFAATHNAQTELAAVNAENGSERCQFAATHNAQTELAAGNTEKGTPRCQFPRTPHCRTSRAALRRAATAAPSWWRCGLSALGATKSSSATIT